MIRAALGYCSSCSSTGVLVLQKRHLTDYVKYFLIRNKENSHQKAIQRSKGFQKSVKETSGKDVLKSRPKVETATLSSDSSNNQQSGSLPLVVSERMLKRMLVKFDITVIPSAVGYSTLAFTFLAMAGLTYGIFSSSWDPEIEGSLFGFMEFRKNIIRTLYATKRNSKKSS
eukprot:jgi/Galph1/438/GphlegSOOS_G5195.1